MQYILEDNTNTYNAFGDGIRNLVHKGAKKETFEPVDLGQKPMGLLPGASQRSKEDTDKEAEAWAEKNKEALKKKGIVGSGKVKQFIADQGGIEGATAKLANIGKNVKDFVSLFKGDSGFHLTNTGGGDIEDGGLGGSPKYNETAAQKADREAAEAQKAAEAKSRRNTIILGSSIGGLVLIGVVVLLVRRHRKGK